MISKKYNMAVFGHYMYVFPIPPGLSAGDPARAAPGPTASVAVALKAGASPPEANQVTI